jgi:hypothetical protein
VAEVSGAARPQTALVDVLIQLDHEQPPAGTVLRLRREEQAAREASAAFSFVGWLGLLRALGELIDEGRSEADG